MSGVQERRSPAHSYADALASVAGRDPLVHLFETPGAPRELGRAFRQQHAPRSAEGSLEVALTGGAAGRERGARWVVHTSLDECVGPGFRALWSATRQPTGDLHLVAAGGVAASPHPAAFSDIGLLRGIPHLNLVVPADAPSTAAALEVLVQSETASYLRLPGLEEVPTVTGGEFELGRARELRPGADLTIAAVGRAVGRGLEVSEELRRVGLSVRVLDLASVKPVDTKAILRAARDTGAILTMEDHVVATGVGALVATLVAEEYPVPVRRLGAPDLAPEAAATAETNLDTIGLTRARGLDEAWELLRMRGKVQ